MITSSDESVGLLDTKTRVEIAEDRFHQIYEQVKVCEGIGGVSSILKKADKTYKKAQTNNLDDLNKLEKKINSITKEMLRSATQMLGPLDEVVKRERDRQAKERLAPVTPSIPSA